MENIAILGDGGFAREVYFLIHQINAIYKKWNVCAFLVPKTETIKNIYGIPILEETCISNFDNIHIVTGMGSPEIKQKAIAGILKKTPKIKFATLIHPRVEAASNSVFVEQSLKINDGAIITAGNILTVNITMGEHSHLNLDCTVGHDSTIGTFATVSPGVHISGNVEIGDGTFIGTGASIIEGIRIGKGAIIGAGACVTKDIPDYSMAFGVPAKVIKNLPHPD